MLGLLLFWLTTPAWAEPWLSEGVPPEAEGYRTTTLVEGLENPWGMAWLPDGRLLVTERPGRLRLIEADSLQPEPIAGLPTIFAVGQGGLLDIALHPEFETTAWLYFSYSAGTPEANQVRVARARWQDDALTDWEDIYAVEPLKPGSQHFGSRLGWLPDGTLLVAIGDGGNPPLELDGAFIREQAQRTDSDLGKVLRISDDGSIPSDNPTDSAIWSLGHRNIQGLAIDPLTGAVWATEHGPRGGDELNALEPGANYGWPTVSYGRDYLTRRPVANQQSSPDTVAPIAAWIPTSIAPSGLAIYRGEFFPEWQGNVFAGALVSRDIRRLVIEDGQVITEEQIPIGQRVRDVRQGADGHLYILTDETNGALLRLDPL